MSPLENTITEMAGVINGALALTIVSMDGFSVAEYNPKGVDTEAFSARFSVIMNLVAQWTQELGDWGNFEENLVVVKTDKSWLLVWFLSNKYYLGVALSRKGTLGDAATVLRKYASRLRKELLSLDRL